MMLTLARPAQEVTCPTVRAPATDELHDPRYGCIRGRKLLAAPTLAIPAQSVVAGGNISNSVRGGKKCDVIDLGGMEPKLARALVDAQRDPTQVSGEKIGKHGRRQAGSESCLQPMQWPDEATSVVYQKQHGAFLGGTAQYRTCPPPWARRSGSLAGREKQSRTIFHLSAPNAISFATRSATQ